MESDNQQLVDSRADLWVLEGVLDVPIVLPQPLAGPNKGKNVRGLSIDLGTGDGDGFIELAARDVARVSDSSWWSHEEPVLFEFRCGVIAAEPLVAWLRANDFLEQMLDRLTFLAGVPVKTISISELYNETELNECKDGTRSSFQVQFSGQPTLMTGPCRNFHLLQHRPSPRAKLALRWFRKALSFAQEEDQFLAYFVALEVISDDIKPPERIDMRCKACGSQVNSFTSHLEGVKEVIRQRRLAELPKDIFNVIRRVRARIAHGDLSPELSTEIRIYLPLIEQLAAEAITISLGSDPCSISMPGNMRVYDVAICGTGDFSADKNPHTRWGRSLGEAVASLRKCHNAV